MQLESQVNIATAYISTPNTTTGPSPTLQLPSVTSEQISSLISSLNQLADKLSALPDLLAKSHTVNVFNNTKKPAFFEKATQTTCILPSSSDASAVAAVVPTEDATMESDTVSSPQNHEDILTCTLCNETLPSSTQLNYHLETDHDVTKKRNLNQTETNCLFCGDFFPTKEDLGQHVSSTHATESLSPKTKSL